MVEADTDIDPTHVMEEKGYGQVRDHGKIQEIVDQIIENYPAQVEQFKQGKEAILSLPFTIQNPTVKDLQVHSVEEIQAYIHQQRGVESMNTKIKRQADGIAQEISHLGLDLDAA